jgi:hypothetical protein
MYPAAEQYPTASLNSLREHPFPTMPRVAPEDVDGMRRSLAIGGSLTRADTEHLLDTCQALLDQRAAIAAVLGQLGPSLRDTRAALNELARIVRGLDRAEPASTAEVPP